MSENVHNWIRETCAAFLETDVEISQVRCTVTPAPPGWTAILVDWDDMAWTEILAELPMDLFGNQTAIKVLLYFYLANGKTKTRTGNFEVAQEVDVEQLPSDDDDKHGRSTSENRMTDEVILGALKLQLQANTTQQSTFLKAAALVVKGAEPVHRVNAMLIQENEKLRMRLDVLQERVLEMTVSSAVDEVTRQHEKVLEEMSEHYETRENVYSVIENVAHTLRHGFEVRAVRELRNKKVGETDETVLSQVVALLRQPERAVYIMAFLGDETDLFLKTADEIRELQSRHSK